MNEKDRVLYIIDILKEKYPKVECTLEYENEPYKLLITARLSAQCTDERVNIVTPSLFAEFASLEDFADADLEKLEKAIFSCGLYKTKAKNIKDMCRILIDEYNSTVPDTMDELLKLPGIGRKIANLILGDVFGKPAVVTDTHCIRISNRLGLCESQNPHIVEKQLWNVIPKEKYGESNDFCHRLVYFGREYCKSQNPRCNICFLNSVCRYKEKTGVDKK